MKNLIILLLLMPTVLFAQQTEKYIKEIKTRNVCKQQNDTIWGTRTTACCELKSGTLVHQQGEYELEEYFFVQVIAVRGHFDTTKQEVVFQDAIPSEASGAPADTWLPDLVPDPCSGLIKVWSENEYADYNSAQSERDLWRAYGYRDSFVKRRKRLKARKEG